jgi:two-component system sensor histidine kinase/response regulator
VLGHDLRNPLSVILAAAELIKRRASDDAMTRNADRIVTSGKWMGRMIDDILDLARARLAGGIPLTRATIDFGALMQRVVQDHQAAHAGSDIVLRQEGDVVGTWDADRLAQAASNLIGNALQHGAPDKPIDVELDGAAQDSVTLSVANSGTIAPSLQDHIFDPFRSGRPQTSKSGGLGLGLFIVQQIAKAHQGIVEIDVSQADRTVFRMTVPRRAAAKARAHPPGADVEATWGRRKF